MARLADLTVIIPARNEEAALTETLCSLPGNVPVCVIDDYSVDRTADVGRVLGVTVWPNLEEPGYGGAIQTGIRTVQTPYLTIMTADGSDDPETLPHFAALLRPDRLVFADRWQRGGPRDYPWLKRGVNRAGNHLIGWRRRIDYEDWTDPFKAYPTALAQSLLPLAARGMSAGLELALRSAAICPRIAVVPTRWQNRRAGHSKFRPQQVLEYLHTTWRWA